MRFFDLTHKIENKMPVYPGTASPKIVDSNTISVDGFREKLLTFSSHTGTHIDAPYHFLEEGKSLDEYPISHFFGSAVLFDCKDCKNNKIPLEIFLPKAQEIQKADFVILQTGWSRFWDTDKYFTGFSVLNCTAAKWLAEMDLKGIGVDTISIDKADSKTFSNHKIFMNKKMIIIENLTNLQSIKKTEFQLAVLPINIRKSDGAPVRAVAR